LGEKFRGRKNPENMKKKDTPLDLAILNAPDICGILPTRSLSEGAAKRESPIAPNQ
jgi:hypothetical protein